MTATSTRSARGRSAPAPPPSTSLPLGAPLFVLNLKTYPSALGSRGLALAERFERSARSAGVRAAIAPATPDLAILAASVRLPVLAQHTDPEPAGATTGAVPAEAIAAAGGRGSLVNHSEHPLPFGSIRRALGQLASCGLVGVACAPNAARAARIARLGPRYVAVEPPELIGGTRAVSTARPELIARTVAAVARVAPGTAVLCGAGIHSRSDVAKALALGSRGILVASAVVRARDPGRAIDDLFAGF